MAGTSTSKPKPAAPGPATSDNLLHGPAVRPARAAAIEWRPDWRPSTDERKEAKAAAKRLEESGAYDVVEVLPPGATLNVPDAWE